MKTRAWISGTLAIKKKLTPLWQTPSGCAWWIFASKIKNPETLDSLVRDQGLLTVYLIPTEPKVSMTKVGQAIVFWLQFAHSCITDTVADSSHYTSLLTFRDVQRKSLYSFEISLYAVAFWDCSIDELKSVFVEFIFSAFHKLWNAPIGYS